MRHQLVYVSAQYCRMRDWETIISMGQGRGSWPKNMDIPVDPVWFSPRGSGYHPGWYRLWKKHFVRYGCTIILPSETGCFVYKKGLFISRQHPTYCDNLSQELLQLLTKNICFRWNTDHHLRICLNIVRTLSKPFSMGYQQTQSLQNSIIHNLSLV